jgi:hypothetical protein
VLFYLIKHFTHINKEYEKKKEYEWLSWNQTKPKKKTKTKLEDSHHNHKKTTYKKRKIEKIREKGDTEQDLREKITKEKRIQESFNGDFANIIKEKKKRP